MIHPLSDVQTVNIGENTIIWQYAIVLKNAIIGNN
jgi:UDP-3-O-[3-hydroxymyristoyl] glucosamine N-acyltransferase